MIGMIVGDCDGDNTVGIDAEAQQSTSSFARTETAVDQNPSASCLNQPGIPPAAATERCESHRKAF
jgi:hypothetical protein